MNVYFRMLPVLIGLFYQLAGARCCILSNKIECKEGHANAISPGITNELIP